MSDPGADLLLALYDTYRATAYSNLVVGILFGAYTVLYGTSLYILLRNGGLLRSAPRLFMLAVTTAAFVLGLIALVLETSLCYQQFTLDLSPSSSSLWSMRRTNVTTAVGATIACTIYIITDVVCAWRAAVLWNYDRRVVAALGLFLLGTTAATGSNLGLSLHPLFSHSNRSAQNGSGAILTGHRALILVGPTLATNCLSMSLIVIQAWRKRRVLISHLGKYNTATKAEKVLAMLVESGFAYCCIWILYLIATFRAFPDPGFAVMDAALPYISGLYPTIIIILVVLRKSPTFTITKRPASTHVLGPPQFTTGETRIPLSIICIRREELNNGSDRTMLRSPALNPKDKQ